MNEEEKRAIEYFEQIVGIDKKYEYRPIIIKNADNTKREFEIILNYIDKLQKKNDNLNKKNKRYEKYLKNKDMEHEKVLEYIETEKERDYISKDKIRDKIKELGSIKGDLATYIAVTEKIKVLNELLDE